MKRIASQMSALHLRLSNKYSEILFVVLIHKFYKYRENHRISHLDGMYNFIIKCASRTIIVENIMQWLFYSNSSYTR